MFNWIYSPGYRHDVVWMQPIRITNLALAPGRNSVTNYPQVRALYYHATNRKTYFGLILIRFIAKTQYSLRLKGASWRGNLGRATALCNQGYMTRKHTYFAV